MNRRRLGILGVLAALTMACAGLESPRRSVSGAPAGDTDSGWTDESQSERDVERWVSNNDGRPPAGQGGTATPLPPSPSTPSTPPPSSAPPPPSSTPSPPASSTPTPPPSSTPAPPSPPPPSSGPRGPMGRAIGALTPDACMAELRRLRVPHDVVRDAEVRDAIDAPVTPTGPIDGITVTFSGRRAIHRMMDCRLVLAIHAWAPALRAVGITGIRHLSAYRPGAVVRTTGRPSGHARGLAFDPRFFLTGDGEAAFDVLEDWQPRTRGSAPCPGPSSTGDRAADAMRSVVCRAISDELFQVVVTPHHDDAHANHVHLEVVPGAGWTWAA